MAFLKWLVKDIGNKNQSAEINFVTNKTCYA